MTTARWALEVAAAGGHHLGMVGPVGTCKALLAYCLPSLLPDLDDEAALEVTALRAAAGLHPTSLVRRPPLREPHHTTSDAALLGGGPRLAIPGQVSLAHHGVLFADCAPEFRNATLSALRQVVDCGQVHLAGGGRRRVSYPARFQLVLAAQPCPCADAAAEPCPICTAPVRRRYLARMAPLWARTDIRLHLAVPTSSATTGGESSAVVAARVARARELAADRWAALGLRVNAEVPGHILRTGVCQLPTCDINPLLHQVHVGAISDDGHDRVLRLAWTISDLRAADRPDRDDITAAIDLHLDR
jgi:magnesium chelatase family protein